jgi:type VI secretion system protein ImpM
MNWPWRRTSAAPSLQPTAALRGKLPSRPDFVREGGQGRAADALDAWLVQASPLLHAADGASVSDLPVCWFGHGFPKHNSVLVGVLGPSRDSAGREFPVAVFRESALGERRKHFAALLSEHAEFLDAAELLLVALPDLSLEELRARLVSLPIPVADSAPVIEPRQAGSRLRQLFEADPPGSLFYALSTFVSAFADTDATTQLALDCPVREAADARIWLALAALISAQNPACPSFLFAPEPARLLISVAAPGAELLCALAQPGFSGERVWPLTTAHLPAIEHARSTLLPVLPELAAEHEASLSLRELGERLARAGAAIAM